MAAKPLRIILFCRSLDRGGAERQIIYLARGLQKAGHQVVILTLYPPAPSWYDVTGLTVINLSKESRWDLIGFILSYARFIKSFKADVLYSFLTVQNIIAALTSLFTPLKVVCGLRVSFMDFTQYSVLDRVLHKLEIQLYRLNIKVIANSHAGREILLKKAPYTLNKVAVITNGLDLTENEFSTSKRQEFRSALGLNDKDILIGHVGRYDPMKDHKTFIEAAARVLTYNPNCYFLCWGHGDPTYLQSLKDYAKSQRVNIIWHSERSHPCYSAFDIYCLSSIGEGYSNTLCEAMSHGLPCITTDVGDCRQIVENFGVVVAPANADALAAALQEVIGTLPAIPNIRQVAYCKERFSLDQLVNSTLQELTRL